MEEKLKEMLEGAVVGIDLGTTNTCIGIYNKIKERVELIESNEKEKIFPSVIGFDKDEIIIGQNAKQMMEREKVKNVIYEIKRLIGRKFDDAEVQEDIKSWNFDVVKDKNSERPQISVNFLGQDRTYEPEQISAFFLNKLIKIIKKGKLNGKDVGYAVITVPARFNNAQRQATKDAARVALIKNIYMINEPTAAAIAYKLDDQKNANKKILVFDLGGGTFDVSILQIKDNEIKVLATGGDSHLGGKDFDKRLYDHVLKEIIEQKKGKGGLTDNEKIKIMKSCELAKIKLSSDTSTSVMDDIEVDLDIFNDICEDLFEKCINIMDETLRNADLDKDDINEYILVGGSTRMQRIKDLLKDYFGKEPKALPEGINEDNVVAVGATIYANKIFNKKKYNFEFKDIIPSAIGIETNNGEFSQIIPKFATFPTDSYDKEYVTTEDNQTKVTIKLFEGNEELSIDNNLLGEFEADITPLPAKNEELSKDNSLLGEFKADITPLPAKKCIINVSLELDKDGILKVKILEKGTKKEIYYQLKNNGLLSEKQVTKMIGDAKIYEEKENNSEKFTATIKKMKEKIKRIEKNCNYNENQMIFSRIENIKSYIGSIDFEKENPSELFKELDKLLGTLEKFEKSIN